MEATYGKERGIGYQGYIANRNEICKPENELQHINKMQWVSNNVDDNKLLAEALIDLNEYKILDTLYRDGC